MARRLKSDYLENAQTQIHFHKRMMKLWQWLSPVMFVAYITSFIFTRYSVEIVGGIGFVTCMLSLYANWDTDFGALSASQASLKADQVSDQVDDVSDAVDDINVDDMQAEPLSF